MPTIVAAVESHRTVNPPYSQRLKTSRPSASAPNSAFVDGPAFGAATNSVGECGATNRPKSAMTTMRTTIPSPMRVRVSPSERRMIHSHWWPRSSSWVGCGALDRALEAEIDGGVDGLIGGHRPAVLSRGVTMIVARSAARFRNT